MEKTGGDKKSKPNDKTDEKRSKSSKESDSNAVKKKKRKGKQQQSDGKQLNRKKSKREEGAPKLPLTGYVRYMNKRRDELKTEFPDKTSIEHTKIIAEEWNSLSEETKKPFLQAAEIDKERYSKEINEFNKSKSGTQKVEESRECTPQSTGSRNSNTSNDKSTSQMNGNKDPNLSTPMAVIPKQFRRNGDQGIPIFTDEFLEHNKTVDLELRVLRKSNVDYEQQNSVLEKHIENMRFGVEKMNTENAELEEKNRILEAYLDKLKCKLIQSMSGLSLPNEANGATPDNLDKYMTDLHAMATSNSHGPACLNKAKDIVRKLDLQIQL